MKIIKNGLAYLGDCIDVMDDMIEKGTKVDLIVTDPPYDIQINSGGTVNTIKKLDKSLNEGVKKAKLDKGFYYGAVFERLDKLQDNINVYFFCSKKQIMIYMNRYVNEKKCTFDILFWNKNNALPTYSNKYIADCEYLLHFRKGAKCKPANYEDAKTVYYAPMNVKDKKIWGHPTIKPLPLIERIVRNSSREGDIVFDPFAGSFTTAVACENTNRKWICIEKDENYFNIGINRVGNQQMRK